jgi:hypothetical protein
MKRSKYASAQSWNKRCYSLSSNELHQLYSVFQGFRQAKSANGGSILSSSQFFDTALSASKNEARFKSGQSGLVNNHLPT